MALSFGPKRNFRAYLQVLSTLASDDVVLAVSDVRGVDGGLITITLGRAIYCCIPLLGGAGWVGLTRGLAMLSRVVGARLGCCK